MITPTTSGLYDRIVLLDDVGEALAYVQGESLKANATSLVVGLSTPRRPERGECMYASHIIMIVGLSFLGAAFVFICVCAQKKMHAVAVKAKRVRDA